MAQLSELDVQNLRHLIGGSETCHAKFSAYAQEATDSQVRQYFEQAAQSAKENKQQLMGFLKQEEQIMMDEKTMVSDTLTGINGELKMYAEYISQSEDPKLKQTLKQMRNKAEAAQEQIYQIAREKSYYVPAAPASKEEIEQVRSLFKPESML